MSGEILSKLGIICPCFKPIFKKKKDKYQLNKPGKGTPDSNVDLQNNTVYRSEKEVVVRFEDNNQKSTVESSVKNEAEIRVEQQIEVNGIDDDNQIKVNTEKVTENLKKEPLDKQTDQIEVTEDVIVVQSEPGLKAYRPGEGTEVNYSRREGADIENMDDITEVFKEVSEGKSEVDAYQLQAVLNNCFQKEFEFDGFSSDLCRSMVAMHDTDLSGKLGYPEFQDLWKDLDVWKETYVSHDADGNGYFDKSEFAEILEQIGLPVGDDIVHALTVRYSDRDGHVHFDDFIACAIKLKTAIETYKAKEEDGSAEFSTDEFIQLGMYT